MSSWLRWIALQAAWSQATMVAVRVTAGYRALDLDAGAAGLGVIASAFAVPALLAAIPVGRASDRFGGATVSICGVALNAVGIATALLAPSFAGLVIACAVSGLGHVAALVGQQTFVAQHAEDRNSDSAFGILTASSSVGQLIAPPAVGLALTFPLTPMPPSATGLLVALGFALASTLGILPLQRRDRHRAASAAPDGVSSVAQTGVPGRWRAVVVSGIVLAAIDLLYSFLPLWASEKGISPFHVGMLLAVRAVFGVASRFGLGTLVTRFGRKTLIVVSTLSAAAGLSALPFAGLVGAYLAMVGIGIGLALPQPLTVTWLLSGIPRPGRGKLLGIRMTANRAVQSALPLSIGVIAAPIGASGVFAVSAMLLGGAAALAATSVAEASDDR